MTTFEMDTVRISFLEKREREREREREKKGKMSLAILIAEGQA